MASISTSLTTTNNEQILNNRYRNLLLEEIKKDIQSIPILDLIKIIVDYLDDEVERIDFFANKFKEIPWIRSFTATTLETMELLFPRFRSAGHPISCEPVRMDCKVVKVNEGVIAEKKESETSYQVYELAIKYFQNHPTYYKYCLLNESAIKKYGIVEFASLYNVNIKEFLKHCEKLTFDEIAVIKGLLNLY